MIKAKTITSEGGDVFILGLSEGNLRLLREERPMEIDLAAMGGPPGSMVVILYGQTEDHILQYLRDTGFKLPGDPGWEATESPGAPGERCLTSIADGRCAGLTGHEGEHYANARDRDSGVRLKVTEETKK